MKPLKAAYLFILLPCIMLSSCFKDSTVTYLPGDLTATVTSKANGTQYIDFGQSNTSIYFPYDATPKYMALDATNPQISWLHFEYQYTNQVNPMPVGTSTGIGAFYQSFAIGAISAPVFTVTSYNSAQHILSATISNFSFRVGTDTITFSNCRLTIYSYPE